jgi:hypothetical protein
MVSCRDAVERIRGWIGDNEIKILNVAGPKASKDSQIYRVTMDLLDATLSMVKKP